MTTSARWKGLRLLGAGLASLVFASSAAAQAPQVKRLAVLEFRGEAADAAALIALADEARAGALDSVKPLGYLVMTRESMAVLIKQMQGAICREGECEVETGRNIGADLVLTGEVSSIEGARHLTLKLHETARGALLASTSVEGQNLRDILKQLRPVTADLLQGAVASEASARPVPRAAPPIVEGHIGDVPTLATLPGGVGADVEEIAVQFTSEPAGAVVRIDGALLCQATPCSKRVAAGRHLLTMEKERYLRAEKTVQVARGSGPFRMGLAPDFAMLDVATTPPGASVFLDGKPIGSTPISGLEVDEGGHEVLVDDRCYFKSGERVRLERGERRSLQLALTARTGTVKVLGEDASGTPIDGEVLVDGRELGSTGKRLVVPVCARTISVQGPGDLGWTAELAIKEGSDSNLTAVLRHTMTAEEKQAAERRAAADYVGYRGVSVSYLQPNIGERPEMAGGMIAFNAFEVSPSSTVTAALEYGAGAGVTSDGYFVMDARVGGGLAFRAGVLVFVPAIGLGIDRISPTLQKYVPLAPYGSLGGRVLLHAASFLTVEAHAEHLIRAGEASDTSGFSSYGSTTSTKGAHEVAANSEDRLEARLILRNVPMRVLWLGARYTFIGDYRMAGLELGTWF